MQNSSFLYDRLAQIGIAVPRGRSTNLLKQNVGPAGAVNARPYAHGPLVPPNVSAQNQTNQNGPIPNAYGLFRYWPPYGAFPYTEYSGDAYARSLYLIGYGSVEILSIWIGDILLNPVGLSGSTVGKDAKYDVEVEVRYGLAGDTPMTLYPQVAEEDGGGAVTLDVNWAYKETPVPCDEIINDFYWPQGLYQTQTTTTTDASGKQVSVTTRIGKNCDIRIEYASCDSSENLTSGWTDAGDIFETSTSPTAFFTSRRIKVTRGLYIVRCQTYTNPSTDNGTHDQVDWERLTAMVNEDPTPTLYNTDGSVIPIAKLAIRANVSNTKISQALDNVSVLVQRQLKVWNGTSFSVQSTSNPAWALLDVFTNQLNKRAISTSRFDLAGLLEWANQCDSVGLQYNNVIDTQVTAFQLAQEICTAGRASFCQQNGLYGVFADFPQTAIAQYFTPRNTSNFKITMTWPIIPPALRVQFTNPDVEYQQDEVFAYNDGFNVDGSGGKQRAYESDTYQLPGVTSATQAQKLGRYYLAAGTLRPRTLTFDTDFEHLLCNLGDRIKVTHDVLLVGAGQGYISSLALDGSGNITGLTIDDQVVLNSNLSYSMRLRRVDGSSLLESIVNTGNQTNTFTFVTPIPAATMPFPQLEDLVTIGSGPDADFIVTKIEPKSSPHMSCTITAVDYSDEIFTADTEDFGTFVSSINVPVGIQNVDVAPPIVAGVQSDDTVSLSLPGGATQSAIVVTFRPPNDARVTVVASQYVLSGSGGNWLPGPTADVKAGQLIIAPVQAGLTYDIQIRSETPYGLASDWVSVSSVGVGATVNLPPDVTSANVINGVMTWDAPALPANFAGYAVRTVAGSTVNWAQGTPVVVGLVLINQMDVSKYPAGTRVFMIKAVDLLGNESADPCSVTVDVGDPVTTNIVIPYDFKANSFPGTFTGAAIDGSGNLTATSLGLMWGDNDSATFWNPTGSTLMWQNPNNTLQYICQFPVSAGELPGNLFIQDQTFVGLGWTIEYCFSDSDPLMWPSPGSAEWTSGSAPFWTVDFSDYQPWPGSLPAQTGIYQFRITIPGGQQQGSIQAFTVALDVPDVSESIGGMAVAATTGTRVPITKTYRVIEVVNITKEGGGTGLSVAWIDKVTTIGAGPLIKVFDGSGNAVAGTVDVIIQGY